MMSHSDHNKRPETDLAVALSHRAGSTSAPRISATGQGPVAEQIVQIALDNGIRIREDADLASILSALEVDSVIPIEAFAAVAEILAYLYRANGADVGEIEKAMAAQDWRQSDQAHEETAIDDNTPANPANPNLRGPGQ